MELSKYLSEDGTIMKFGFFFNQKLDPETIPESVTHLTFGYCFNQKLEPGIIPESVIHLTFGFWFDQSKENITVYQTIKQIKIRNAVYDYGTGEFDNRFTVYQKPVKGAINL